MVANACIFATRIDTHGQRHLLEQGTQYVFPQDEKIPSRSIVVL